MVVMMPGSWRDWGEAEGRKQMSTIGRTRTKWSQKVGPLGYNARLRHRQAAVVKHPATRNREGGMAALFAPFELLRSKGMSSASDTMNSSEAYQWAISSGCQQMNCSKTLKTWSAVNLILQANQVHFRSVRLGA